MNYVTSLRCVFGGLCCVICSKYAFQIHLHGISVRNIDCCTKCWSVFFIASFDRRLVSSDSPRNTESLKVRLPVLKRPPSVSTAFSQRCRSVTHTAA